MADDVDDDEDSDDEVISVKHRTIILHFFQSNCLKNELWVTKQQRQGQKAEEQEAGKRVVPAAVEPVLSKCEIVVLHCNCIWGN